MSDIRIAIAQANFLVGDIEGNAKKIVDLIRLARDDEGADLVVFPELALTGYPPEDLLLRNELYVRCAKAIQEISAETGSIAAVIGAPERFNDERYNAALVIEAGQIIARYHKMSLPNYSVFDERRYFTPGTKPSVFEFKGAKIGLTVCEDLWHPEPCRLTADAGAQLIININASPFHYGKTLERETLLKLRAKETGCAFVYCNLVGGQDELVFDGDSAAISTNGELAFREKALKESLSVINYQVESGAFNHSQISELLSEEQAVYETIVMGIRDYVAKNRFQGVVLGLSGGIDSALTLALAVDALGADKVEAVMMPSEFTSQMSLDLASEQAQVMGVKYHTVPIKSVFEEFKAILNPVFGNTPTDVTEENIQARCRGVILMAISNKQGRLLLTTGNKSEVAVGYATLYGDMAGGFAPIKDVPKTLVYRLAQYRNSIEPVIPVGVIERPPSAELRADQKDQDSLPPYDVLDAILELYVEGDKSVMDIVATGFDEETVKRVIRLVDLSEYKRRQAAPGVRITRRAFGRDRRYPITSAF